MLVITPVKNSIDTTLKCAKAISESLLSVEHLIFNDFSSEDTKEKLEQYKEEVGYNLLHLEDLTSTPSPNYKLVLQMGQKEAVKRKMPLVVIESDVIVKPDTLNKLKEFLESNPRTGLLGAITVDEAGQVNFPYLKFKGKKEKVIKTERSLSFCCTLFSAQFLESFDFSELDDAKDWYDTFMSKKSIELGFINYVLMDTPVVHLPHSSRPWKQLKYSNPLKYYFLKFIKGRDKI
jgi:GT2 family glycosyltransferase